MTLTVTMPEGLYQETEQAAQERHGGNKSAFVRWALKTVLGKSRNEDEGCKSA